MRIAEWVVGAWLVAAAAAAGTLRERCDFLSRADGATNDVAIVAALDALRAMRGKAVPAAETVSALLPHRAKLYRERDKYLVVRLRAYAMVTLSEIGVPRSAVPALLDTLANVDDRMMPVEVAAAARAVASLGSRGHDFAPYLLEALSLRILPEELSLERYEQNFPPSEATTAQREIVQALARISTRDDRSVVDALRQLAASKGNDAIDPRLPSEAARALQIIEGERP